MRAAFASSDICSYLKIYLAQHSQPPNLKDISDTTRSTPAQQHTTIMKRNRSYQDDEDEYEPPTKKTTRKTTKKTPKKAPSLRVTRLMKVDASRRAVFETVELLENILEQLPPREIIVCERVCKQVSVGDEQEYLAGTDWRL